MKIVRINTDDSMNEISLKNTKNIMRSLEKESNSRGSSKLKELYNWNHNGYSINCYGWYEGEAGFENKHDLIPNGISDFLEEDSSEKLLFGNIFMVQKDAQGKYIDFNVSDYANVYTELFEGFDECTSGEEEEEDEEEDEHDKSFIVNETDDEDSDDSYEYKEDDELDIDENEY